MGSILQVYNAGTKMGIDQWGKGGLPEGSNWVRQKHIAAG